MNLTKYGIRYSNVNYISPRVSSSLYLLLFVIAAEYYEIRLIHARNIDIRNSIIHCMYYHIYLRRHISSYNICKVPMMYLLSLVKIVYNVNSCCLYNMQQYCHLVEPIRGVTFKLCRKNTKASQ